MGLTDLHSHVIPGVDDGAGSVEEACAALGALRAAGVTTVVATPHVQASLTRAPDALEARLAEVETGWRALTEEVAPWVEGLTVLRGAELELDTPDPDFSDPRLRLGGGPAVLVEFPNLAVPPNSQVVLGRIRAGGWTPVLAHPERYAGVGSIVGAVRAWREAGALLQVNAGSLLGRYGAEARRRAWALLEHGLADCIASDYHARGNVRLQELVAHLAEKGAGEQARLLTGINPARILAGEPPIPVGPLRLRRGALWARVVRLVRALR
ncbi:MAG TPA: CpsB/CapC family capsule biosynthesis tyrosine phosphatase [Longimicrobiales bacterium]|nr:CpsB/CapC family capsule biosynthesis tyrosine phosphatase [Longimicrobiales bacterium]